VKSFVVLVGVVILAAFFGCSSPPPPLRQSCEARSKWPLSSDCVVCVTQATRMRCDCDTVPAAGACNDASRAYGSSPDCGAAVTDCVTACAADCACVDACYQAHATCRALAEKLQGCIVQVCDARCR
jgi:hypothetical protein